MEKFINAAEARLLSQQIPKSLPSADVVQLANHQIRKAAASGLSKASFPCPREEAPYIQQRLEIYDFFILGYANEHDQPVYQINVYWNEVEFLTDKTLHEKQFPVILYTRKGIASLKPYLPDFFPEYRDNVTQPSEIAYDPRPNGASKRRSN